LSFGLFGGGSCYRIVKGREEEKEKGREGGREGGSEGGREGGREID